MTFAQSYKYEQDFYNKNMTNIKDNYGNVIGYIKRDFYDKAKLNIYDKNGNIVSSMKDDYFDKEKTNTYDSYGNKKGSAKKDFYNKAKELMIPDDYLTRLQNERQININDYIKTIQDK